MSYNYLVEFETKVKNETIKENLKFDGFTEAREFIEDICKKKNDYHLTAYNNKGDKIFEKEKHIFIAKDCASIGFIKKDSKSKSGEYFCTTLKKLECKDCPFYKSKANAEKEKLAVKERLCSLPYEKRVDISSKYGFPSSYLKLVE